MGWNGANEYFDVVAKGLQEGHASRTTKLKVLVPLIRALNEGDWDTQDESVEAFADDWEILDAFEEAGIDVSCRDYSRKHEVQCGKRAGHTSRGIKHGIDWD